MLAIVGEESRVGVSRLDPGQLLESSLTFFSFLGVGPHPQSDHFKNLLGAFLRRPCVPFRQHDASQVGRSGRPPRIDLGIK